MNRGRLSSSPSVLRATIAALGIESFVTDAPCQTFLRSSALVTTTSRRATRYARKSNTRACIGTTAPSRRSSNSSSSSSNKLTVSDVNANMHISGSPSTRSRTAQWKTGFHRIARGAGLPIQLSYLDWGGRRCGLGPLVDPGDDVDADIARIKDYYKPFKGRNADQFDAGTGPR